MIPSREQIERWGQDTGDGWVRIPASSWSELLWCLSQAEKSEAANLLLREERDEDKKRLSDAHAAVQYAREQGFNEGAAEAARLREERDGAREALKEAREKITAEEERAERDADSLYGEGHSYASGKVDAYEFALVALAAASVPGQEGETPP